MGSIVLCLPWSWSSLGICSWSLLVTLGPGLKEPWVCPNGCSCEICFCMAVCASRILLQTFSWNAAFCSCWVQENPAELFCCSWSPNSTAFELLLVSDSSLGLWHGWRLSIVDHTACPVCSKQEADVCVVTLFPFAPVEAHQLYWSYM